MAYGAKPRAVLRERMVLSHVRLRSRACAETGSTQVRELLSPYAYALRVRYWRGVSECEVRYCASVWCGTKLAYGATSLQQAQDAQAQRLHPTIVLCNPYAMSGTGIGYALARRNVWYWHRLCRGTGCPVLRQAMLLRTQYAMSGTEAGYAATHSAMLLHTHNAVCGTEIGYGATRASDGRGERGEAFTQLGFALPYLPTKVLAMSGTGIAYADYLKRDV
eukprot:1282267-Rhodomonas_salina.3